MAKKEITAGKNENTKKEKEQPDITIEEAFKKLDEAIAKLESEDISLEDSLNAYEEGMKYIHSCNDAIDRAEKKVLVIRENGELDEF